MSVNRNVTVPVGGLGIRTQLLHPLSLRRTL
jgi:hypothetical protein